MPRRPSPPDPYLLAQILQLRESNVPWKEIARDYHIARSTVWYWIHYEERKTFVERLRRLSREETTAQLGETTV